MAPKSKKTGAVAKIMTALAGFHSMGEEYPTKEEVGTRAGVNASSSTMRSACAYFKKNGLVDTSDPKRLKLTQKGHDEARNMTIELPKTNKEFHDRFKATILGNKGSKKSLEIFDLLANGPPLTKQQIGKAISVEATKSTFRSAMAPLNKSGFLEELPGKRFQL